MITLAHNCKCSSLSVFPKNWKSKSAKTSIDWHIVYRFYDSRFSKPKQVMVQRMNHFKSLPERQKATEKILEEELDRLIRLQFHPFNNHTNLTSSLCSR